MRAMRMKIWALWRRVWLGLILLGLWSSVSQPTLAQGARGPVYTLELRGVFSSVTATQVQRALQLAESANATALIISIGPDGGVLRDVQATARKLADATVPVVVFAEPAGTQTGLPGAMLLSAAHISALSPGASFGSSRPLAEIDPTITPQTRRALLNGLSDELRGWNVRAGRSVAWLDQAATSGAIISSEQAVSINPPAVNLVAADKTQLLTLLEGRQAVLADGRTLILNTLGRAPQAVEPSLWEMLQLALAEPTVTFALLLLGAAGIYFEIASPGTMLFGAIGVIALLGAAFGLLVLPVIPWALAVLAVGLLLIGLEFVVHSHGGLTVGGITLLVIGAINLFDTSVAPGAAISPWVIALTGVGLGGVVAAGATLAMRTRKAPVRTGTNALIGQVGEVRRRLEPEGMVFIDGALWRAVSEDGEIEAGELVRVTAVHKLDLIVRRALDT